MLTIWFGDMEKVNYGPTWFKYNYDPEWLRDPFVQEMIEAVDKSRYIDGLVIDSPVYGPIPPERLSGGVRTLIMIYEEPELIFDATSCGGNCARWLLEIGKRKDVTVNLNYLMDFAGLEPFEIHIANAGKTVRSMREYVLTALNYLQHQ